MSLTELGNVILLLVFAVAMFCAFQAHMAFSSRFRYSGSAQMLTLCFIAIAIGMGIFTLTARVQTSLALEARQTLGLIGLGLLFLALCGISWAFYDIHKRIK